jgi:hypothetical protein
MSWPLVAFSMSRPPLLFGMQPSAKGNPASQSAISNIIKRQATKAADLPSMFLG